uniref:Zinc_ribbon_16 domain-containing protein n=1 Tax=Rhabditophanes sp. KR3021 TaxID=114890 RepID=A0AC35UHS9_9BILA
MKKAVIFSKSHYNSHVHWLNCDDDKYIYFKDNSMKFVENTKRYTEENGWVDYEDESEIPLKSSKGDIFTAFHVSSENLIAYGSTRGVIHFVDPLSKLGFIGSDLRLTSDTKESNIIYNLRYCHQNPKRIACITNNNGRNNFDTWISVLDIEKPNVYGNANIIANSYLSDKIKGFSWIDESTYVTCSKKVLKIVSTKNKGEKVDELLLTQPGYKVAGENQDDRIIAMYTDGYINIYDRRYFKMPAYEINVNITKAEKANGRVLKLEWNKNRNYDLTFLYKGKTIMNLLTNSNNNFAINAKREEMFKNLKNLNEISASQMIEEYADHCKKNPFVIFPIPINPDSMTISYDWHPRKADYLITLNEAGGIKKKFVNHRATGKYFIKLKRGNRCIEGYGYGTSEDPILSTIEKCCRVIEIDKFTPQRQKMMLVNCWNWLQRMIIPEIRKDVIGDKYNSKFPGILEIATKGFPKFYKALGLQLPMVEAVHYERQQRAEHDSKFSELMERFSYYKHEKRDDILRICNWPLIDDVESENYIELRNTTDLRKCSRNIAVAVFTNNVNLARELISKFVLDSSTNINFLRQHDLMKQFETLIKMHRGGPISDFKKLSVIKRYDEYMFAILLYINSSNVGTYDTYKEIFLLERISLVDKIAFASMFLSDDEFFRIMNTTKANMVGNGNITGIILTGLGNNETSHQLLHNFLDRTGDLQTTALLLILGDCVSEPLNFPIAPIIKVGVSHKEKISRRNSFSTTQKNLDKLKTKRRLERSKFIIRSYMDILNVWQLFIPRTFLNCLITAIHKSNISQDAVCSKMETVINPATVSLCCLFCRKPFIGEDKAQINAARINSQTTPLTKKNESLPLRSFACVSCKKPLPKCSICRLHLGTLIPEDESDKIDNAVLQWFVWCSNCLHGSHMKCMVGWFEDYSICCVNGCQCSCMNRDYRLLSEVKKFRLDE